MVDRQRGASLDVTFKASRNAARDLIPSFGKIRYRWDETVRGDMYSRAEISRLVKPVAASSAISRSWGVSDGGPTPESRCRVSPVARSSISARRAHERAPSCSNPWHAADSWLRASRVRRTRRRRSPYASRTHASSNGHLLDPRQRKRLAEQIRHFLV
jgi:hypothetical protein